MFFAGYALLELPSNLIMHRVGARIWMARIMVTWGLVSAAMMFAHTPTTFYVLRLHRRPAAVLDLPHRLLVGRRAAGGIASTAATFDTSGGRTTY